MKCGLLDMAGMKHGVKKCRLNDRIQSLHPKVLVYSL